VQYTQAPAFLVFRVLNEPLDHFLSLDSRASRTRQPVRTVTVDPSADSISVTVHARRTLVVLEAHLVEYLHHIPLSVREVPVLVDVRIVLRPGSAGQKRNVQVIEETQGNKISYMFPHGVVRCADMASGTQMQLCTDFSCKHLLKRTALLVIFGSYHDAAPRSP
jgi:hypothetical protein